MKKILAVFLLLLVAACGKTGNDNNNNGNSTVNNQKPAVIESNIDTTKTNNNNNDPNARDTKNIPEEFVKVVDVKGVRKAKTTIVVVMSKDIDNTFDPTAYIKVSPETNFTVAKYGNQIILNGDFDPEKDYEVTVLKGIKAADNTVSKDEKKEKVVFDQLEPKIAFSSDGIILTSKNSKQLLFNSLNVNKVYITVRKVYENNMTQFLHKFNFKYNGNLRDMDDYEFDNFSDMILDKNYFIDNVKNKWVQNAIDLNGVITENGMYIVNVNFDIDGTSYTAPDGTEDYTIRRMIRNNGDISKAIIVSDIGMIAYSEGNKLSVKVMNILENKPISGAKVKLISRSNQQIEEKTTDGAGDVEFTNTINKFYLLCENGNEKSVLELTTPLSMDGFSTSGVYASGGIKGYIYTERGVYRPGDPVNVSIIARNNNEPLPNDHPITVTVYTPTGTKYVDKAVIKEGKDGFYTYSFKTKVSDQTGLWKLEAQVGSETLTQDISIETVVPYKIKNEINLPETVDPNKGSFSWEVASKYLFGAPASDLKFDASLIVNEEKVQLEKYPNYNFKNPTSYDYYDESELDGTLDKSGKAILSTDLTKLSFSSVNLIMTIITRVYEDSGRPVISRNYTTLKQFNNYLGIENSAEDGYVKLGSKLGIRVITPTVDGENLVAGRKLVYRIYKNTYSWWWDYSSYNEFMRSLKGDKNTKLLVEKEFTSTDRPYLIEDTVDTYGYVYIEVEDKESGQITGTNIYATEWADPSTIKREESLKISTDKKVYVPGEKAIVKFTGVEGSKALVAIEKQGTIIKRYLKDVNSNEMTEEIDLDKTMAPNIYVHVALLQDYNKKENDRSLRLYGTVPVMVEDEGTKLNIAIDAPEDIRPNEKFKVKIKNSANKQINYTVAVVDYGLLDITGFKTPSPWEYFNKKLASMVSIFDNYSEVIDRPFGYVHQILKTGGDELMDSVEGSKRRKNLGIEDPDRFKPVSLFQGVLTTNDKGEGEAEFTMPNYMGMVRIMVVGAAKDSYGSSEKDMVVKAPIVVQPALPRTLKVKDKFTFPVNIFALEDNVGDVEVEYTFKGKTQKQTVNNLAKGEKKTLFFTSDVEQEVGNEKINIKARSKVYNYEDTVSIAVNSDSMPIYISDNKTLTGKQEYVIDQNQDYIKGTVDSAITISNTPLLGIDQRLKFLITYPYGCVEQTTSATLPQIFLDRLMTNNNYNKEEVLDNINGGIQRLTKFQLSDGSFTYWPGEGETNEWATNYVGQLFIYAKKNGYYVPDGMYNRWISYLKNSVKRQDIDVEVKAYRLYLLALSGNSVMSEMNYMHDNNMGNILNKSKMYLAAAYKLSGEEKVAKKIADEVDPFDLSDYTSSYYRYTYGSELRELAVYLDCYTTVYGKVNQKVYDEVVSRLRSKSWYSTQAIGYSMIALSNIAQANDGKEIKGILELDGKPVEYNAKGKYQYKIDPQVKSIKIKPDTDGNTYMSYFWEGSPINSTVENYSDTLVINREFFDNKGEVIDPRSLTSGQSFWLGVTVDSMVSPFEVDNIALTQILPSGWEIENLRATGTEPPQWVKDRTKNVEEYLTYEDIRDDRIMWFFNYYDYGNTRYTFFVKVNAVTKGTFDFPGTKVEAMYDNTYKAYLKGFKVEVK